MHDMFLEMSVQFDLEILHHILNQFSENVARDCSRIIEKLLKDLTDSTANLVKFQDKKTFAVVEVLVYLYEKLQQERKHEFHESELPVHLIIQSIQHFQECSEKNCKLPDKVVQCNILSIISLMYKSALLQNNTENLEDLVKFYDCILMSIYKRGDNKECKSDCWLFKLKIINSMYHALNSFASSNVEFQEKHKLINNLDESKIFGDLVLYENDDIAIQTLMCLIPEYINCFKNGKVVKVIWKLISDSMTDSSVDYSRALTVLCKVFDFCVEKCALKDSVDLTALLLEDSNYWKLIQLALVEEDSLKRKKGFYLIKKTIHLLNNTNKNIKCSREDLIFYWNMSSKDELYEIYSEIIIILEFLEEQQVHIVKPVFGMIESLCRKIIKCDKVSYSWILLIYKKSLMHESIQIVKWGLSSLLELSEEFFSNEYVVKEIVELLIVTLSNMNLYYNDNWEITRELKQFFDKVINLSTSKTFFNLFIKCLCHQVWSAETLFFVIHSLSGIENCDKKSFWGEEEIFEIKEFVSKAFKTHNKIIRTGVQCELLKAISHLTDCRKVPLENLILLLSRFSIGEVLPFGTPTMITFIEWLWNSYPEQEFKNVIERYKRGELEKEFNEKCISLIFILFYLVSAKDVDESTFKMNYLQDLLLSFKEIDKRPYCNKTLQNQYLSVVIHIYEANVNNCISGLVKCTLPFVSDIVVYIFSQLQQISSLQDFNSCQFYLNAFVNIIKGLILIEANNEFITDLYIKLLKDLEVACMKSDISSIELYYKMKLLSIILELYPLEPKRSFLDSYLLMEVNEPLKKDSDYSEQTRDSQTLWGKMNSEFLEGKWKILEFLINKKLIIYGPSADQSGKVGKDAWISHDNLLEFCGNALVTGGYGVLCPVMSILKDLLPMLKNASEIRKVVESVWKVISERRKTEEFKLFIKHFVEMLFQEALILTGDFARDILLQYADFIYSDSSLAVVNIFIKHFQQINISDVSVPLFCHVIGKGLLFGPVQRKDENLTNKVCDRIRFLKICEASQIGDFNLNQEIRARAVQKILTLEKTCETHKTVARSLICTLLEMENEINKNRVRYFGDSHTHRVKHRLMQALLLLEPLLDPNEKQAIKLSEWLLQCIVSENSQPSVRYMQEWLLVRMIVRHSELNKCVSISNHSLNDEEISKKSLCSLIAITFHICRLIPSDQVEERILLELCGILSLCFHQHFEVRLYAQVVFMKLYNFSKSRKLVGIIKQFEYFYRILEDIFLSARKGNFSKNVLKLTEDFYLNTFEPIEHYSLETIYMDLPRLTNTGSDERISTEVFQNCGVDSYSGSTPLRAENTSLKYVNETERFTKKFNSDTSSDLQVDEILGNYQKKIIPMKPLIPVWDENDSDRKCNLKKGNSGHTDTGLDGLVVVASLIDRIPNLGGLARTCEIFGASEYVVNSLKYTEDKQFTSLSVTAEKWIPVKEVRIQNLLDYILEMKQIGYTVVGAEQALYSVPLSAVKFPKKSLLLLGNEKEGIPPNLLPLLDICVEIPQVGIIRSLNVHVTGALFIWEYAKQNLFS